MEVKRIKIPGKGNFQRTVVEENQFRELFEKQGKTKKWFAQNGIGHRTWALSLEHWGYDSIKIEELRRKKLLSCCIRNKPTLFRERIKILSKRFPELEESFWDYEKNPTRLAQDIVSINNEIYDLKEHIRKIKKHIGRRVKNNNQNINLNFVANGLENKVRKILDDMGLDWVSCFQLENRFYDFFLLEHNTLIEVDGRQYHSAKSNLKKNRLAKKHNYKLIRLKEKNIKYDNYIKDKIRKAIG